nr:hypothetical protein BaRGS_009299 [Batillaria attramentaria]
MRALCIVLISCLMLQVVLSTYVGRYPGSYSPYRSSPYGYRRVGRYPGGGGYYPQRNYRYRSGGYYPGSKYGYRSGGYNRGGYPGHYY